MTGASPIEPPRGRVSASVVVRVGTEEDVDGCVQVALAIGLDDPSAWRATFKRTVEDGIERVLHVAEIGSVIVGYGRTVHAVGPAQPAGWHLLGVAVLPMWRRRGIGEGLTRARMQWVSQRAQCVYYFTHRDNHASHALHERLGFAEIRPAFLPPGGTPEFAGTQRLYVATLPTEISGVSRRA